MSAGGAPRLVVLAAGASARLGECKALVELAGKTALDRLLDAATAVGDPEPLVVTGADHGAIAAALARSTRVPAARVIENEHWTEGRTGGLALAAALRAGEDLLVAPIDVPLVPREAFALLVARWRDAGSPARGWLAPAYEAPAAPPGARSRRAGHPLVLGRALAARLAELRPDTSLRVLRADADPAWTVAVPWPEVLDDLDTPEDLAALRARLARDPGHPA